MCVGVNGRASGREWEKENVESAIGGTNLDSTNRKSQDILHINKICRNDMLQDSIDCSIFYGRQNSTYFSKFP